MNLTSALYLTLSIVLGGGRTMLSKSISGQTFGERGFFLTQGTLFLSGAVLLFAVNPTAFSGLLPISMLFGAIYALFSMVSQWCYTVALRNGEASICGTVYSMGFVIPTLAGMLFWDEKVTLPKVIGILIVIPTLIISGSKNSSTDKKIIKKAELGKNSFGKKISNLGYIVPLTVAMLVAGSLGVYQKYLPTSPSASQISAVIIISFVISASVSALLSIFAKPTVITNPKRTFLSAAGVGICFGSCNFLNTLLAGMLDSTILFPTLNIGIILFTLALGMLFFGEKFTRKNALVLALGISAILLFTFFD